MKRWIALGVSAAAALVIIIAARKGYRDESTFGARPDALPVRIEVVDSMWQEHATDVLAAVAVWNQAAGCEIARLVDRAARVHIGWDGDAVCDNGDDAPKTAAGTTTYCRDGHVQIRMRDLSENIAERLGHEIGHALGHPAHDRAWIMARTAPNAHVSDKDRDQLRRWCP